ncbi:hypothetical protein A2572_03640 [Candidatus Collierbacteria bacterium RIFOXYD1_FULL_40_9]|uniref:Uncharacterized protein n=1 Tax=Candidatus Collierbacteria bacterium RIFOXYD1_FULL_40_9 TaxID=1817731 RepID=A0A1F5FTK3_9BACT|nr:MAG: hypothetical protein A2572_03640 [Candidatus Collierbacteria bacterium RIFOXYD1_FULL_40_9]
MKFKNTLKALIYFFIAISIFTIYILLNKAIIKAATGEHMNFLQSALFTIWFVSGYIGYGTNKPMVGIIPTGMTFFIIVFLPIELINPSLDPSKGLVALISPMLIGLSTGYPTAMLISGLQKPPNTN